MTSSINIKAIQEEHLKELGSYLDSMAIGATFSTVDFVQDTKNPPENCRQRCIDLEGMDIDKIVYVIMERFQERGIKSTGYWTAFCLYAIGCRIGKDKKTWKNLNAKVKIKYKKGEVADLKWSGGKIADILNKDSALKDSLMKNLTDSLRAGGETEIALWPKLQLCDSDIKMMARIIGIEGAPDDPENALRKYEPLKEGIMILSCATRGYGNEIRPLILPSREGFMAYNEVARHIRNYVNSNII